MEMNYIKLAAIAAPLLALALPASAAHAQVIWQAPKTYTTAGETFTAFTLPGAQVIAKGMTMPVFKLPPPNAPGLPRVPMLACFEADGPGGLLMTAPPGSWIGIEDNNGSITLLQDGSACLWTDGVKYHLRQ